MSVLSGQEIRRRLAITGDDQLVISPLLEPEEQVRRDQASVDIRLGFTFALVLPSTYGAIDELDGRSQHAVRQEINRHYKFDYIPFGGKITIHPHQFVLASSFEYVRLPKNLMAQVIGRSTWGRLGLIVATAIGVHPHFAGTLTLELRNLGETPLVLHPGQSIAQVFFHTIERPYRGKRAGQYSGSVDLLPRNMSSPATYERLKRYTGARIVGDIMHRGLEMPLVPVGTSLADAIAEITNKGMGCVGVTNERSELVGIVTDGDLRRNMSPRLLQRPIEDIMTHSPKTVTSDTSIISALDFLTNQSITALIVVDGRTPIGIVHLHDLLRASVR